MISIIIPVYREAENIEKTAKGIDAVLSAHKIMYEIIFVDDNSMDGTVAICERLAQTLPIRLIVRTKDRGLSESVIEGFQHVSGDIVAVMDADLSHPPAAIPQIIQSIETDDADFVIGSRYVKGGTVDKTWSALRRLNSIAATLPARLLVSVKDPMSGFFAFHRRELSTLPDLNPIGYKIGLEILVKGQFNKIREIPIHFSERQYGQSKLNFREQAAYLKHLVRLYRYQYPEVTRLVTYAIVGFSGFWVDSIVYLTLKGSLSAPHVLARAIAFWPAATWGWALHRLITFHDRPKRQKGKQWLKFISGTGLSFGLNLGIYTLLTRYVPFFQHYLYGAMITGIIAAAGFNFLFSNLFVFSQNRRAK